LFIWGLTEMTIYADFVAKIEVGFDGVELLFVSLILVVVLLYVGE